MSIGILTWFLIERRIEQVLPLMRGDILDLGCGEATILSRLPGRTSYYGVDSRPDMVNALMRRHPGVPFACCDLDRDLLELGRTFDTILMMAVLEHLERPDFLLTQLPALLNPGGRLVITTPTPGGDRIHHLGAKIGLFSNFAAEEHETIFHRATLEDLLSRSGMKMTVYRRFLFGQNQLCAAETVWRRV